MPIIDGKNVSPDHAIHQGLCPECGAKLDHRTALPHAQGHWGMDANNPRLSEEGRRRFGLVLDFIEIAKPKARPEADAKSPMPITPNTSKIESAAPTNNIVVLGFCELWGLIFGLPPGEDLYRGGPVTVRMVVFLAIGGTFAILGPTWPALKSKFPRRLSATFVRTASDFRWWGVALLVGLISPALTGRFAQPVPNRVVGHLRDFDTGEIIGHMTDYSGNVATGSAPALSKSPAKGDSPLAEDSLKWRIASHLWDDFHAQKERTCRAVIIHYDSPYSEDTAEDIRAVLNASGCQNEEQQANYPLRKGISVWTSRTGTPAAMAGYFRNRLFDKEHIDVGFEFLDTPDPHRPSFMSPDTAFAITVGNQPSAR
jgi:hypothetical protein